jgi:hypothetical protein
MIFLLLILALTLLFGNSFSTIFACNQNMQKRNICNLELSMLKYIVGKTYFHFAM